MSSLISPYEFTEVTHQLRSFFDERGFQEVHTQNRLSILAACEDPTTVATYEYNGTIWPLPQTGQMWLEYELLTRPELEGCYCLSTSYRQEPNAIEGRHEIIFPMFEFESHGDMDDMIELEKELLEHLGFGDTFKQIKYDDASEKYGVEELGYDENVLDGVTVAAKNPGSWANGIRIGIIDGRADQIITITDSSAINLGDAVSQTAANIVVSTSAGSTEALDGTFKGIVTGKNDTLNTVDVKFLAHVSTGGTETAKDYNSTYKFVNGAIDFPNSGAGTTSANITRGALDSSKTTHDAGIVIN